MILTNQFGLLYISGHVRPGRSTFSPFTLLNTARRTISYLMYTMLFSYVNYPMTNLSCDGGVCKLYENDELLLTFAAHKDVTLAEGSLMITHRSTGVSLR